MAQAHNIEHVMYIGNDSTEPPGSLTSREMKRKLTRRSLTAAKGQNIQVGRHCRMRISPTQW